MSTSKETNMNANPIRIRQRRTFILRRSAAALAACALGLGAAGCAEDTSTTSAGAGDRGTSTAPSTVEDGHSGSVDHGQSGDHQSGTVEVAAVDYGFRGLPDRIAAGSRLRLTNDAPAELHELVAIRLPDDESRTVEELMDLPSDELGALLGAAPPATVLLAPPGAPEIEAVGDGTLNQAGRYLIMCSVPTGVDPAEYLAAAAASAPAPPQVKGGPPHFMNGMVDDLIVE